MKNCTIVGCLGVVEFAFLLKRDHLRILILDPMVWKRSNFIVFVRLHFSHTRDFSPVGDYSTSFSHSPQVLFSALTQYFCAHHGILRRKRVREKNSLAVLKSLLCTRSNNRPRERESKEVPLLIVAYIFLSGCTCKMQFLSTFAFLSFFLWQ